MIHQQLGRSPLVNKNLEHVYGAKNLPSDEIDKVVTNQFMKDAYALDQLRNEQYLARKKASEPRGIKERQTVTSLMRIEHSR